MRERLHEDRGMEAQWRHVQMPGIACARMYTSDQLPAAIWEFGNETLLVEWLLRAIRTDASCGEAVRQGTGCGSTGAGGSCCFGSFPGR